MSRFTTLTVVTFFLLLASCKKEDPIPASPIANLEFSVYDFRALGDSVIIDAPTPSTLILKSNNTWSLDLGGAKSSGTYTWTPTTNQQANVKFTILEWTNYTANQVVSDKLKSAMLAVTSCGYSLNTPSFANFLDLTYQGTNFPYLRSNRR
jgi:hypothetical protein